MSNEAVHGFIAKVNSDAELGALVTQAFAQKTDLDLVQLAGQHGFAFSREEGQQVWDELVASGELSDVMLEAVAGGSVACKNSNSMPDPSTL